MKKIQPEERRIANIHEAEYTAWRNEDGSYSRSSVLQLDDAHELGVGFHVYRMEPGEWSEPHEHTGTEQFLVLEGELVECDGTVYRKGDLVWLKKGHAAHLARAQRLPAGGPYRNARKGNPG